MTTTPTPQRPDARELLDRMAEALRAAHCIGYADECLDEEANKTLRGVDAILAEYDALPAAPAVDESFAALQKRCTTLNAENDRLLRIIGRSRQHNRC